MSQRIVEPCAEWANRLALRPGDLSPSERAARQEHLRSCAACAATFADYQDLIARIRALPQPEVRPSLLPDLFTVQGSQKRGNMLNESKSIIEEQQEQASSESERVVPLFQPRKRPVRRRVMALVAVLLVGVLVGSFALLTTRNSGVGAGAFSLYRGWTQVALYQGTGSRTISIGNLQMPRLWGYAYACEGSGGVSIKMIGTAYTGETGTDKCTSAANVSPMSLSLMLKPVALQTIKVTANVSTRWSFQIVEETEQPSWPLRTSSWVAGIGFGGTGNNSAPVRGNVPTLYNEAGQQFVPKVWGMLLVCIGTGHGSIQLNPGSATIGFPACDGQPSFAPVRYPTATQISEFQATVTGNMLWSVLIIGCTSADSTSCR